MSELKHEQCRAGVFYFVIILYAFWQTVLGYQQNIAESNYEEKRIGEDAKNNELKRIDRQQDALTSEDKDMKKIKRELIEMKKLLEEYKDQNNENAEGSDEDTIRNQNAIN